MTLPETTGHELVGELFERDKPLGQLDLSFAAKGLLDGQPDITTADIYNVLHGPDFNWPEVLSKGPDGQNASPQERADNLLDAVLRAVGLRLSDTEISTLSASLSAGQCDLEIAELIVHIHEGVSILRDRAEAQLDEMLEDHSLTEVVNNVSSRSDELQGTAIMRFLNQYRSSNRSVSARSAMAERAQLTARMMLILAKQQDSKPNQPKLVPRGGLENVPITAAE